MTRKNDVQDRMGAAFHRDRSAQQVEPFNEARPTAKRSKTTVEFEQADYRRLKVWLVENQMTLQGLVQAAAAEVLDGSPMFADMLRARARARDTGRD
ncbi:MAG: hypothetical protein ACRDQA_31775 [Nocardioidaceae bacterium]